MSETDLEITQGLEMMARSKASLIAFFCAICILLSRVTLAETADEAALIARLHGPQEDARTAARALGRTRSGAGLKIILDGDDDFLIHEFGSGGNQSGRGAVLPAEIETLIVSHYDRLASSRYGNLVNTLIDGAHYQSRELLRLLLADSRRTVDVWRRGEQPPGRPDATFDALTKTDLPIGRDVLALIRDIPSHPTTVSPRCSLAGYFKDHSEPSAVPALVDVLRKNDEEYVASCVSSVLGAMATADSIDAVVQESQRVQPTNAKLANRELSSLMDQLRQFRPDVAIDLSDLRQALPPPGEAPDVAAKYVELVRYRKATASVPLLISYLSAESVPDGLQRAAVHALLEVGSRADWTKALVSTERGFTEKRVSGSRLNITRSMLGPAIDPQGYRSQQAAAAAGADDAGRRGDAKFLADAIAHGDSAILREFTRGFRSVERPHIPPEVEKLIVAHFDDGEVGKMLPPLVGPEEPGLKPSLYHGRDLFDRFAEQMRKGTGSDAVRRIFSTDSPIEEPLLALLKGPHLPTGSCEVAKYLARRRYAPVIPYLKNALAVGMSPETSNAGCPKEALVELGTPEALAAAALPDQWSADRRAPAAAEALRKAGAVPLGTPLDFEALRRAIGTPIPHSVADDYCRFAMRRKPPEAVPDLLAFLSQRAKGASLDPHALSALLAYDSPDVWKQTRQEVERLYNERRIGQWSHDEAIASIDELLADPRKTIAQRNFQRPHPADGELEGWDETKLLAEIGKVEGQAGRDVARVLGEHSSERGFAALVKRRDPSLVQAFAGGMLKSQAKLTPAMESVVLANLQDERLSDPLKYLISLVSYHDRRIFDRFADEIGRARTPMDRAMIAPVLAKTDLPVEAEVVTLLERLPKGPQEMMARCPLVRFLGERRYREAVKPLSSEIQTATPEMSRCIATVLEKIGTAEALAAVMERIRTLRADPATAHVGTWIEQEAVQTVKDVPADAPAAFLEAKRARERPPTPAPLAPKPGERPWEIARTLQTDPAAHVKDVEARLDAVASALPPGRHADRDLVGAYLRLASVLRFTLKDVDQAITIYEKARPLARPENGAMLSVDLAIADIHQFDKRKPRDAIDHLQKVLEQITATGASTPDPRGQLAQMLDPISAWVREDIRFLETGQPFAGSLPLQSTGVLFMGTVLTEGIRPDPKLPPLSEVSGGLDPDGRMPLPPRDVLAKRLLSLPPSRAILFQTMGYLTRLEPDEILAYLARQDPGRYLTALILATAALEDYELELGRRAGRSMFVQGPEPGQRYTRSPLRVVAEQFAKTSGIRFETPPFVREQGSTPEEIDVVVQSTWKKLKDALRKGDIEAALGGVAIGERAKYRSAFQALKDDKTNIDQLMTEIHKVAIRDGSAEYAMLRPENGKTMSFMVEFIRDADGIWRLSNM